MKKLKIYYIIFIASTSAVLLLIGTASKNTSLPVVQTVSGINLPQSTTEGPRGPAELPTEPYSTPGTPNKTLSTKPLPTPTASQAAPVAPTCPGDFTEAFFCLLNQYRASRGLKPISQNSALASVAQGHSQWMNTTGTFSHTGVNGSRLSERCAASGITCRGENLAEGAKSAQNLFTMWKASGSHNQNLLGNFSTAGIGISGQYITLLLN